MEIDNSYLAFCFDEACSYYEQMIKEKRTPVYEHDDKANRKPDGAINSISEWYKSMGV